MTSALPQAVADALQAASAGSDFIELADRRVPRYSAELWTAAQRQAHSLHEVSYRACFKPQLPRFFIERLSEPGDVVYDPFAGRGTTAIESALLGRRVMLNDVNPLSQVLTLPRLNPPTVAAVEQRLTRIAVTGWARNTADVPDLSMFYHADTLRELLRLRAHLLKVRETGEEDAVDRWVRMVATNRLTGHSSGFFSVYTLPPNQAVTQERQRKINAQRKQTPGYRDVHATILRKTRSLLMDVTPADAAALRRAARSARAFTLPAAQRLPVRGGLVQLTVTSPPFLNVVQYARDNWLRLWFNGIDDRVGNHITMAKSVAEWQSAMRDVFVELFRLAKTGGWVAFEVGEVRGGRVKLDEATLPVGMGAGFEPVAVLVNTQSFTKTANIWGVNNNARGTNSNRIVLFRKP